MEACGSGHVGVAAALLARGADPNKHKINNRDTALMRASQGGHLDCVRSLLDHGADPERVRIDNGSTALIKAATKGHTAVMVQLLEAGADPCLAPAPGCWSALMRACQSGRIESTRILLGVGANPDHAKADTGETALMFATYGGHVDVVRMLLEAGAAPDRPLCIFDGGATPAMAAAQNGRMQILQLLGAFGADIELDGKVRAKAKFFYRTAVLSWLDAVSGWSPLKIAVGCRLHDVAKTALRLGKIDARGAGANELVEIASHPNLWGAGSPAVCVPTLAFARYAAGPWSPASHPMYHGGFRRAIKHVLMVSIRLRDGGGGGGAGGGDGGGGDEGGDWAAVLPPELWLELCSFLIRRDWPVQLGGVTK